VVTEEEIDGVAGRALDVLIETKIMGRKVRFVEGQPCAWDSDGKVIMKGLDDYLLEDYAPERDGKPVSGFDPRRVLEYSNYDLGMVRVMDRLAAAPGVKDLALMWSAADPAWVAAVKWYDEGQKLVRQVKGRDGKYARLAVYRAALKAVLT
jgi:hypothetical protein